MTQPITTEPVSEPANEPANEAVDVKKIQHELELALAEKKKLKESFDKTASEIAEYKRKEKERMTEEELKASEIEALKNDYKAVTLDLNKTKAEGVFAKKGWEESEYKGVIEALASNVPPEKMSDLATEITRLVEKREAKTAELTKTALTKDTDTKIKQGTKPEVSEFKAYQEQKKPSFEKKLTF